MTMLCNDAVSPMSFGDAPSSAPIQVPIARTDDKKTIAKLLTSVFMVSAL